MMWPKGTRTSIDAVESYSPLVRVVREENWVMLMDELRDLRGERSAVVAYLVRCGLISAAEGVREGEHRREEAHHDRT